MDKSLTLLVIIGFIFASSFLPVYHKLILVPIFQVFASLGCSASGAGIPPFPVFGDPPEYEYLFATGGGWGRCGMVGGWIEGGEESWLGAGK
jgi:hypothetical protein